VGVERGDAFTGKGAVFPAAACSSPTQEVNPKGDCTTRKACGRVDSGEVMETQSRPKRLYQGYCSEENWRGRDRSVGGQGSHQSYSGLERTVRN